MVSSIDFSPQKPDYRAAQGGRTVGSAYNPLNTASGDSVQFASKVGMRFGSNNDNNQANPEEGGSCLSSVVNWFKETGLWLWDKFLRLIRLRKDEEGPAQTPVVEDTQNPPSPAPAQPATGKTESGGADSAAGSSGASSSGTTEGAGTDSAAGSAEASSSGTIEEAGTDSEAGSAEASSSGTTEEAGTDSEAGSAEASSSGTTEGASSPAEPENTDSKALSDAKTYISAPGGMNHWKSSVDLIHYNIRSAVKDHADEGYKRHVLGTLAGREDMINNVTDIDALQREIDHLTKVIDGSIPNAADFRMPFKEDGSDKDKAVAEEAVRTTLSIKLKALKLAQQDESVAQYLKDRGILK